MNDDNEKPIINQNYDCALVIHPKIPTIPGIFDIPPDTCIASHSPHKHHVTEHLHDHFYHMHIRYGFEIPVQTFERIDEAALQVSMLVKKQHRVDCNPIFVERGKKF